MYCQLCCSDDDPTYFVPQLKSQRVKRGRINENLRRKDALVRNVDTDPKNNAISTFCERVISPNHDVDPSQELSMRSKQVIYISYRI